MRKEVESKAILYGLLGLILSSFLLTPYAVAGGLKKVVAVSRFENKTSYLGGGQYELDEGMADQLTDALIQSGQFVVLERQTLSDIVAEQDMAASGRFQKSKSAKTGKLISAQILIKGTITEFESKSAGSGTGFGFKKFRIGNKREEAHVGLIIRLIDTTTGEVLASQRVEGKAQAGGFKFGLDIGSVDFGTEGFHKTPLGKATQIAIDNAVKFIAAKLTDIPFQGRVIKVVDSTVFITAGRKTGALVGDIFTVYSIGEELVDPDTGELLGREEEEIGKVKILQVKEKYSKAKPLGTIEGIKRGDIIRSE
jgi:curli biogenesis system outer membrane secretion channel CsgG